MSEEAPIGGVEYDKAMIFDPFQSMSYSRDLETFERVDVSQPGPWAPPNMWYACGTWLFSAFAGDGNGGLYPAGKSKIPNCYNIPGAPHNTATCLRLLSLNLPCQAERGSIPLYPSGAPVNQP